MNDVVNLTERRLAKELREEDETEDAWHVDYDNAASQGYEEADSFSALLGATMSGQQVAIGALRFAFETDGAEGLKAILGELQEAARAWTKEVK